MPPELAWAYHDSADTLPQRGKAPDRIQVAAKIDAGSNIATMPGMRPLMDRFIAPRRHAWTGRYPMPLPGGPSKREITVPRRLAWAKSHKEIPINLVISVNTFSGHVSKIPEKAGVANGSGAL